MPPSGPTPLEVVALRGSSVESRHRVQALVSDASGKILRHWGDPAFSFFPRSSVKLIQAATWVAPGLGRAWNIGEEEMAIACGSHVGEPVHVTLVANWLKKLKLEEKDLDCGTHDPTHRASALALARKGETACQLHNNCSGKHSGLLMACLAEGWPTEGYTNYDHPVQARVREMMGAFLGVGPEGLAWGIDGCGIPSYYTSLKGLALAMARCADPTDLDSQIQEAVKKLNLAIAAHPHLIGGSGSFSTKVVAETEGRVFAKVGAEGVYGAWIPAEGLGIAVKCEDGTVRGAEAALVAILAELGYPLQFYSPYIRRWAGEIVGQYLCG